MYCMNYTYEYLYYILVLSILWPFREKKTNMSDYTLDQSYPSFQVGQVQYLRYSIVGNRPKALRANFNSLVNQGTLEDRGWPG